MNRTGRIAGATIAIILATCAPVASADVVTLSDGSRIVGIVKQLANGKLTMATAFAEAIEIDAALVVSIESDQRFELENADGERLAGPLAWDAVRQQTVVQTDTGPQPIPIAEGVMMWPEGTMSPAEIAIMKELEAKKPKWSFTLEMGATATEGNSDTLSALGRFQAQRKSEKDLLTLYLFGAYGEQDDIRNTAEAKAGGYYEHLFTERFFVYGRGEAEYDEFENLALRLTAAGGPGYYWIKEEKHELKTRAGLGYQYERYLDDFTTEKAIMDIGLDYRLDINEWLRFTNSTVYYPTFEELRDYRLTSDFALLIPLAGSDVWKLKLGALFEYDAIPDPGFERLDQTYYASILLDLK